MQDRFLFRGKVDNSTGWAYGSLIYFQDDDVYSIAQYVPKLQQTIPVKIITESIGQCTGLKDKNGKLIFEGDMFKRDNGVVCVVEWLNDGWYAYYRALILHVNDGIEIIGNIHDSETTEI